MTTDPTPTKLLRQLTALNKTRDQALALYRLPYTAGPALVEMSIFRGATNDEIGAILGLSREAVATRLRPVLRRHGIADLRGIARYEAAEEAGLRSRKYRAMPIADLRQAVIAEAEATVADREALLTRAARLGDDMAAVIDQLSALGVSDPAIAEHLDVSLMTVARLVQVRRAEARKAKASA